MDFGAPQGVQALRAQDSSPPCYASKIALDVLREATEPMRGRDIAIAVLAREGHDNPDTDTITKVANTIGAGLRTARERGSVDRDSGSRNCRKRAGLIVRPHCNSRIAPQPPWTSET